jgi:hypothetical protein
MVNFDELSQNTNPVLNTLREITCFTFTITLWGRISVSPVLQVRSWKSGNVEGLALCNVSISGVKHGSWGTHSFNRSLILMREEFLHLGTSDILGQTTLHGKRYCPGNCRLFKSILKFYALDGSLIPTPSEKTKSVSRPCHIFLRTVVVEQYWLEVWLSHLPSLWSWTNCLSLRLNPFICKRKACLSQEDQEDKIKW